MACRTVLNASALILAFLVLSPSPAAAQEARSFEQLQLLVKPGDRLFISDSAGVLAWASNSDASNDTTTLS